MTEFKYLVLSLLIFATLPVFGAQLNYGKYFGTIQMSKSSNVIAVALDAFVVQPNDPAEYPQMTVIVRTSLGGYVSPEYVGYYFYDPTYNFENGILELNDPKNDLVATLKVTNTDSQTILEGPVTQRLTNAKGVMRVVMNLDDSSPFATRAHGQSNFQSMLKGEYVGTCGNHTADLQIETGRALQTEMPGNALVGYTITGRLGFSDIPFLGQSYDGIPTYSINVYSTGSYSPYTGHLVMQGPLGILDCQKDNETLQCQASGYENNGTCVIEQKSEVPTSPVQIPTSIYMNVPPALKKPLPAPQPPDNDDLVKALNGNFYGFLHYENRDEYQLLEMNVTATTSTENPHIMNRVLVLPTLLLRLGSSWNSTPLEDVQFPQRVFYGSPTFALSGNDSDLIAVIGNWRIGYLSGVLYSRTYGRIGTFELQKGNSPEIPHGMKVVVDPIGHFVGPQESTSPAQGFWSLDIANASFDSTVDSNVSAVTPLIARYSGDGIVKAFDAATYDLNTGTLAFLIKDSKGDRLITGRVGSNRSLNLLWPVGPQLGAPMAAYSTFTYTSSAVGVPQK